MALTWFICPYKPRPSKPRFRYCAMDDFTPQIRADGGDWHETEVLGNRAVVKVRALLVTLTTIAATPGFQRMPKDHLDDSLSDLSPLARQEILDQLEAMGYSLAEIQAALGNDLGTKTLREVLRFAATRRLKPRYDAGTATIVLDGPIQACRSVESVDEAVT